MSGLKIWFKDLKRFTTFTDKAFLAIGVIAVLFMAGAFIANPEPLRGAFIASLALVQAQSMLLHVVTGRFNELKADLPLWRAVHEKLEPGDFVTVYYDNHHKKWVSLVKATRNE